MPFINHAELLQPISDFADGVYLCTQEPGDYAEVLTYAVGRKLSPVLDLPVGDPETGYQVTVQAISDGEIIADGTAGYWAVTSANIAGAGVLWSSGPLAAGQAVVDGNTFTLPAFEAARLNPAT